MSINKNPTKRVVLGIFLALGFLCAAQEHELTENLFVRVYDSNGKKFSKGQLQHISDAGLKLISKDSLVFVPISKIGKIRTKHSLGGNIIMSSIIGGSLGFGLIAGDPETSRSSVYSGGERIAAVSGGLLLGGLIGAGTSVFKKSKAFDIDGDSTALQSFTTALSVYGISPWPKD